MQMKIINENTVINKAEKVESLTTIQKLVCRLFGITAAHKYFYTVTMKLEEPGIVKVSDDIMLEDESLWRVIGMIEEYIQITNHKPIHQFVSGRYLIVISRQHGERSR